MIKTSILYGSEIIDVEFDYMLIRSDIIVGIFEDDIEISCVMYHDIDILSQIDEECLDMLGELAWNHHYDAIETHHAMSDDFRLKN